MTLIYVGRQQIGDGDDFYDGDTGKKIRHDMET
jgi:hypothetical protein